MNEVDTELPFVFFRHSDRRWYRLWVTHTEPRTDRGLPWHVHASYDQSGSLAPVAGTAWFTQPYGMANWDFASAEEALAAFRRRARERIQHGYTLAEGRVPAGPD